MNAVGIMVEVSHVSDEAFGTSPGVALALAGSKVKVRDPQ